VWTHIEPGTSAHVNPNWQESVTLGLLKPGHDGEVQPRVLAGAAAAWSVVYLLAYLWAIDTEEGAIAWWYVALVLIAAVCFTTAALGSSVRVTLTMGLVISAIAMLTALASLGALLAPTVIAAAIALAVTRKVSDAPSQRAVDDRRRGVSR
jgi:hypothetical protein